MKVIKPGVEILDRFDGEEVLKKLELCGRVCYKSEGKVGEGTAEKFVRMIMKSRHESVLEHFSFSVRFICDRGVTHEIVRHRLASYSQESTRYCNYSQDKFGREITVIEPCYLVENPVGYSIWKKACQEAEKAYFNMLDNGHTPQEARAVLPNSLKTDLVMTANIREWRHFLKLRTDKAAHPQMREVALLLLNELKTKIPVLFEDIES
ncbi:MAG TPA: FAD-dependent thymidylate synthase [Clostridiales bacterium]|nr:FAD-dependent thymidylate synthase [Clostridiales bacterium]